MTQQEQDDKQLARDEKILQLARTVARGIGPVLFLVMVLSAVGQGGLDRLISMNTEETLIFGGVLCMFFGIVWAYQNEIAGGIVIIVVYIFVAIISGKVFPNMIFPLFLITGVLNIYIGIMDLALKKRRTPRG